MKSGKFAATAFVLLFAGTLFADDVSGTPVSVGEESVFESKRVKAGRIIVNRVESELCARVNEIVPTPENPFPAEIVVERPAKRKMIVERLSENEQRVAEKKRAREERAAMLAAKKEAALRRKAERDARERMLFDEREREDAKRRAARREKSEEEKAREQRGKDLKEFLKLPPREIVAHPAADVFPGAVPEEIPRVNKAFKTDNEIREWQGTGLYAPPGEIIRVHVSTAGVGTGYRIRIGAHTDNLIEGRKKNCWKRFPAVVREFSVGDSTVEIANPFGGPIYVEAPAPPRRSKISSSDQPRVPRYARFEFVGVVEMPFYELGDTKPQEWEHLRHAPAPWAEIAGKRFIATIPSAVARGLKTPKPLVEFWDKTVEALDKLTGTKPRKSRERVVFDADCVEFFAHGGDVIVLPLELASAFADMEKIRKDGFWPLFFYLARNRVRDAWSLNGNKDAPAALLALACMETATGKKPSALFDVPALHSFALTHPADAGTAEIIGSFLAPAEAFGWNVLAKALDVYNNAKKPPADTELEKAETFVTAWSRAAKSNLGPYFAHFGIEYSKRLEGRLAKFRKFTPKNFPPVLGADKPSADCFLGDAPLGGIDVFFDDYVPPEENEPEFINLDDWEDDDEADASEGDESDAAPPPAPKKKIRV